MWKRLAFQALSLAAAAGSVHVAVSAAATYLAASHESRIFRVTNFPDRADDPQLVGSYLQLQGTDGRTVVAGSSFSFGYPFDASVSFPALMDERPLNASVQAASLLGVYRLVLCEMKIRGLRASRIVIEIPLINEVQHSAGSPGATTSCRAPEQTVSFFHYALQHPNGVHWFELLKEPFGGVTQEREFQVAPVPDDYFVSAPNFEQAKAEFAKRAALVHQAAASVSDEVFVFVTPVYVPGVAMVGKDAANIQAQFEFALDVCRQLAGARCVDTSSMLFREDLFANLTHANVAGSRYLAGLVSSALENAKD